MSGKIPRLIPIQEDDASFGQYIEESPDVKNYMSESRWNKGAGPEIIRFKIELDGQIAGEALLKSIKWQSRKAEVSIYLLEPFRHGGTGKQVVDQLLKYVFEDLGFHRLEAEIYEYNKPSLALAVRSGFVEEGRLREARLHEGKYYDIIRFGLLREEYDQLRK